MPERPPATSATSAAPAARGDASTASAAGAGETLAARVAARGLDWIVPAWNARPGVAALMSTRNRRDDAGRPAALDFGASRPRDDDDAAARAMVEATRRDAALLAGAQPVYVEQVHGRDVAVVQAKDAASLRALPPRADALVTRAFGLPLAIRVADCMPVLFAALDEPVIGVAHAGWRGLAGGVLEATLDAMRAEPARVVAWLGPSIGPRRFEVGGDVVEAFCAQDAQAARHFVAAGTPGKWLADLAGLARARLAACGVVEVSVDGSCTVDEPARFHSWRRDRSSARMAALVWQVAESAGC